MAIEAELTAVLPDCVAEAKFRYPLARNPQNSPPFLGVLGGNCVRLICLPQRNEACRNEVQKH